MQLLTIGWQPSTVETYKLVYAGRVVISGLLWAQNACSELQTCL